MKGAPRSDQFDDIYFSTHDGLEETKHVFLNGNNLPAAWAGRENYVIFETGFGTGLNFFSTWKLFEETAKAEETLDFISIEKYPLTPAVIKDALGPWAEYFDGRIDKFLKQYPIRIAGFHRIKINQQITLTLIFDDVNEVMPKLDIGIDCWFLDGFTPSKNPEMWSETLFTHMARLSNNGATFATFTAAGFVRRGLQEVGFEVQKVEGFKYKSDMSIGRYSNRVENSKTRNKLKKIAVIGGGLAGTACAFVLKQYGFAPVIYEKADSLASGASGNDVGFYNPRFSKLRDELSDFYAPSYAQFISMARDAGEAIEHNPCGALHLMNDEDKNIRLRSMAKNWRWHDDHVQLLDDKETSALAGLELGEGSLYLPDSGSVCPRKLCDYYAQDVEVHLNQEIKNLGNIDADAVVICTAYNSADFDCLSWLSTEKVKGQITTIETNEVIQDIKTNLHYGGYLSMNKNGQHATGATFTKWRKGQEICDEDHERNIENIKSAFPLLKHQEIKAISGWAGFRTATNDRFPVIGRVPNHNNIYVSTAFGSHGLLGSLLGAHHLADLLRGVEVVLPPKTAYALSPQRFIDRAAKKGRVLV